MWSGYLSILCLFIVGAVCTFGVFSEHFDDTLIQRVGMGLLALWCFGRLPAAVRDAAEAQPDLVLHAGMAAFAVGTALKLVRRQTAGKGA